MHKEVGAEENVKGVIEGLLKVFSALNEAYVAYERKEWESFKENYAKFVHQLEDLARKKDLASLNALMAETIRGEFIRGLSFPTDIEKWLENNNLLWAISKIEQHYIDAYASLIDDILDIRGFESKEGRFKRIPLWVWAAHIIWLQILRPMDPRTWINTWRIKYDEYREEKDRGKEADENRLRRLRDELKECLLKAHVLNPNDKIVKWELADIYADEGNYEKAIEYYKSSLNQAESLHALERLCMIYELKGDRKEAISVLEKAIKLSPYMFKNWVHLTKLYVDCGNIDEAKRLAEKLSELKEDISKQSDPSIYARLKNYYEALANCYEIIGDLRKALECFKQLEEIIREHIQGYGKDSPFSTTLHEWVAIVKKIDELSQKVK